MKHLLILLTVVLMGCSSGDGADDRWMDFDGRIKVLATTGIVSELVQAIAQDRVDLITLIHGGMDPHSYELVKGDDEKFQRADIVIFSGLGLEHGLSLRRFLERHPNAVGVGDKIALQDASCLIEVNGQVDPHIWMDVSLWIRGVDVVACALSQLDPTYQSVYEARAQKFKEDLWALDAELRSTLNQVPQEQRYLVTTHDAFHYFSRRYLALDEERIDERWQVRCQAPEGLSPDGQLSGRDIQRVVDHLIKYQVSFVFPESNLSHDSLKKIVHSSLSKGLKVEIANTHLYGDSLGEKGSKGETYTRMMRHNADTIAYCFSKGKQG